MEFRILGPMELWARGERHTPGWAMERRVLACLLLAPGRPVPAETLIERLWDDEPPSRARSLLHTQITRLRGRLHGLDADVRLRHRPGGYVLETDPEKIDYHRFRTLRAQARAVADSGDPGRALRLLREAATLWRGIPLDGVAGTWADRARRNIEEDLLSGALDRLALELSRHGHGEVVTELNDLAARFPYDEKPVELLMVALYRSGRSAEALQIYERLRRRLDDELGATPGAAVRELHRRVLTADPDLMLPARAAPAARRPSDLPRDVPTFTGRTAELAALTALAERDGEAVAVLAVDGMPGVGKTALAVHLAHRLADRYPDGHVFLQLNAHHFEYAPLDPATALERLLSIFGVPVEDQPESLEARAGQWRGRLAGRRVLLVLDDVVGHDQIRHLLPGTPGSLVIVTGRHRLAGLDAVRPVSLDVLAPDDAVRLLSRVTAGRIAAGDPHARTVAALCGHLPLALQLAGSRLLHRPSWSAADLAARLGEGGDRLTGIRAGDRDLTGVFELSYRDLPERARRAFRLLGLYPGADIAAAEAAVLFGASRAQSEEILEILLDHHLVTEPQHGRHRFHDLLREYARRLAAADPPPDGEAALDRLLDHYLDTAGGAGTPRRWLRAEIGNLLAAAAFAADHGRPAHAARLAALLASYMEAGGLWGKAAGLHERAVRIWRDLGDEAAMMRALADLAEIAWRSGDHERALSAAGEGLEIARARRDRRATAGFLDRFGLVHWHRSEYDVATGYFERALAAYRESGERRGEAEVLDHMGIVLWHQGRYADAIARMEAALALYESEGYLHGQQMTLHNIGRVENSIGRYEEAIGHYERSAAVKEMRPQHRAIWLTNVANIYRDTGRAEHAIEEYRRALLIYREIGDRRGECDSLNQIGVCFAQLGREGEAVIHHQMALSLSQDLSERFEQAHALYGIGEAHLRAGRTGPAREHFEKSLEIARSIADAYQEARALDGIADVLTQTRGHAQAEPYRRRAMRLYEELGVPEADSLRARLRGPNDASGA
ncbi:AfsR/SARP family transcriptional regulator [Actinomadura macrotermitis]|uniref:Regulatory protein AfsR n=1 Tax=Actinomadura macrotermitis TaxID=2585200 RepID=A0A7K0BZR0_9ACTN|nr:tetratricopeptide repeat protein [Actinomadura macrotermitis]MQY06556.1 Regulatory protein AfsR [Actinomadura macrotermitis]